MKILNFVFHCIGSLSVTPNSTRPNSPLEGITIPATVAENVIEESEDLCIDKSKNTQNPVNRSMNIKVQNDIATEEQVSSDEHTTQSVGSTDIDVGIDTPAINCPNLNSSSIQDQKTLQVFESENLPKKDIEEDKGVENEMCSTPDYSVPTKRYKVEERTSTSPTLSTSSLNKSSKVKPGTSLLLKRK